MPVGIFKVWLGWLINHHDIGFLLLGWLLSLRADGRGVLITCKNLVRHRAVSGRGLRRYVGCFVVVVQHVMKLKSVELAL
jgi:hypothetical protein